MAIPRFKLVSGKPNVQYLPEAASQSFSAGDLVVLSSGAVQIVSATGAGASGIYGVAAENASGTTSADVAVYVVTPEQVWRAFPNSAVIPSASFSLGVDYKIKQTTTNGGEVSAAAGADAIVVGIKYGGNDGTSAGDPILIRFDSDACQGILG